VHHRRQSCRAGLTVKSLHAGEDKQGDNLARQAIAGGQNDGEQRANTDCEQQRLSWRVVPRGAVPCIHSLSNIEQRWQEGKHGDGSGNPRSEEEPPNLSRTHAKWLLLGVSAPHNTLAVADERLATRERMDLCA